MKTNTHRSRHALMFCLIMSIGSAILWPTVAPAQTLVRSSREEGLRRIEEHRQIRQRTQELSQDLRGVHLTPEQRSEIRQVLRRYNTSTGTNRRQPESSSSSTEGMAQGCGPIAAPPPPAERMTAEVLQVLTPEQTDKLNAIKQAREDRTEKATDFKSKKP